MIEDEMVGWHHQLNGYEFEQTPGDSEEQESLVCCHPWMTFCHSQKVRYNSVNNHHHHNLPEGPGAVPHSSMQFPGPGSIGPYSRDSGTLWYPPVNRHQL